MNQFTILRKLYSDFKLENKTVSFENWYKMKRSRYFISFLTCYLFINLLLLFLLDFLIGIHSVQG